jgi:hypothetical protein
MGEEPHPAGQSSATFLLSEWEIKILFGGISASDWLNQYSDGMKAD